jgi:hypothetical protein
VTSSLKQQTNEFLERYAYWFFLGLVLIACRLIASQTMHVYDDAFITLRYARNLANGIGFVYQPNEWVLGTTAPAFGLINSVFFVLHLPIPETTIALNILADVAILYLTIIIIPVPQRLGTASIFALAFSLSPTLNQLCIGGMETNLFIALSLVVLWLHIQSWHATAILLSTMLYFLRPEALILSGLLIVSEWQQNKKLAICDAVIGLCLGGLLIGTQFLLYHQVLPQSVIAKIALSKPTVVEVLIALLTSDPLIILAIPFAIIGSLLSRKNRAYKLLAVWCAIYIGLYGLTRPHIWPWYGGPIQYAVLALGALGLLGLGQEIFIQLGWCISRRLRWIITVSPVMILLIALLIVTPSQIRPNIYEPMAKWCESTKPHSAIMAYDIGAIGFYCQDAYIYDLAGLVWPKALQLQWADAVIQFYQPEYFFINYNKGNLVWYSNSPFTKEYAPVIRFAPTGDQRLDLNPQSLPNEWVADYILFQRLPIIDSGK